MSKRDTTVLVDVRLLKDIPLSEYVTRTFDHFMKKGFRVILFAGHTHENTGALTYFYERGYANVLIWRDGSVPAEVNILPEWKLIVHDPKCASKCPAGITPSEYEEQTGIVVYDIRCNITEEASSYTFDVFSDDFTLPMEAISNNEDDGNEDFIVLDYAQRNFANWRVSNPPFWKYMDTRKKFNDDISIIIRKRVGDLTVDITDLASVSDEHGGVTMTMPGISASMYHIDRRE